ncbi:rRNA large subunit m3Psi methyltransferase RlmH [Desulfitobacterium dichloroeliminans LMG P-21439]|uniref:Ribosomal RNA large subunit methyltransferase H n=1 Tax=Desulfitobacterium dichloroeliminans (strain LMG P-21439 / DCA1) TaxID=871963 RepID=L0FDZ6_DESDL|nr:23S rRNA (pseudouridine(1915)-N(3))-methyltransferase RlmH [Desulfitobacterium dichloroeliminans]AGA70876.1 rRNA large subunit m3Psi methyltransferase RlmH [Desulfitobacterium dichloroeliminans LMG P-21439]
MLQIKVIAVGKIREKFLVDGIKEYTKRLNTSIHLEIVEIADEPCPERLSFADEERVKSKEGERILKGIGPQEHVILLDLQGKGFSSTGLSEYLDQLVLKGQYSSTFIIGGSLGVSGEVRHRADYRWSFSPLTFPHPLMRLMVLEQIYRAVIINKP